ncbi:MAG: NHL repeat-containing protein [Planctomycetes bacterium]|nr:NHL repeat-containing protein [Planctomycetota bacterium]MCB9869714.1 NHL repeat-containing protein [Planctomycetota bacterium]
MYGGIAVARNLLCLTYTTDRGRVFLVDVEDKRPVDFWEFGDGADGYADAGGVAIDESFTIYVADTHGERVRRFTAFGKALSSFGQPHRRAPGAVSRDRTGFLDRPHAVAEHDEVVYVACGDQHLRRGVQRFSYTGEVLSPLHAFGDPEARFGAPRGMCAGPGGIFVADTLNGVVQRFTSAGRFVHEFATARGVGGISRPIAVQDLGDGTVLVVDQGDQPGLYRVDLNGRVVEALSGTRGIVDAVDLARDDAGRVYVLDRDGERVQRLHPDLTPDTEVLDLAEYLHDR